MSRVLIIDTSILCCWLGVPGKETCGRVDDRWDKKRVDTTIHQEEQKGAIFVLPIATIIETGNHIAHSKERRYEIAFEFAGILRKTAENQSPWAAFTDQSKLWNEEGLKELAEEWPSLAAQGLAIGDSTIKNVANFYTKSGNEVEILTGDQLLRTYTPSKPRLVPRRRK